MNLANMPGWIMTSQTVRAEALLFLLLSWCSTETAVPSDSLWDCLALSLVKYVNETLTKWKSYFCAVLPVLAALSLEYVLYSVPESLKWSNWTLFQESEPLTRKEGRKWAQWKSPEAKELPTHWVHFWLCVLYCTFLTANSLSSSSRFPLSCLDPWLV